MTRDADYHTFEITGTKRMSNRWSLLASYGWTKSFEQASDDPGQLDPRQRVCPVNPNDLINTEDGRFVYTRSTVKLNGTWNSPWWDISFSPLVRYQQGVPFGRTFSTSTLSYGSVRFLAEPMGTRRQDAILITDLRVEKTHQLRRPRHLGVLRPLQHVQREPGAEPAVELGHRVQPPAQHRPAAAGEDRGEAELLKYQ